MENKRKSILFNYNSSKIKSKQHKHANFETYTRRNYRVTWLQVVEQVLLYLVIFYDAWVLYVTEL